MTTFINELQAFLASHIEIDEETQCHNWTHHINNVGYGLVTNRFYKETGMSCAHRLSWLVHRGSIPDGLCVLHRCDNRRCINPEHLWLGTHAENMRDMVAKGRNADCRGEQHPRAKLTEAQVRLIRAARSAGVLCRVIGEAFGITVSQVSHIALGNRWRHIEG